MSGLPHDVYADQRARICIAICVAGRCFVRYPNLLIRRWLLFVMVPVTWMAGPAFPVNSVYEAPDAFVSRHFDGTPPKPAMLYPDAALKKEIKSILGHNYRKFRIRYWLQDTRSVWILEEIGKERPITTGFVINSNGIEQAKVLIFRESRGWEVKYDWFSDQFTGATLVSSYKLDRDIDNITGATLSVRAITKLARMALLLHKAVT